MKIECCKIKFFLFKPYLYICFNNGIIEYLEEEGTYKDHQVHLHFHYVY